MFSRKKCLLVWVVVLLLSGCRAVDIGNEVIPDCTRVGQSWVSPQDGAELMCVPAGEFSMGSDTADAGAGEDESPVHVVAVDAFWMDSTEVTNEQFLGCVEAGVCMERRYSPYLWGVSSLTRTDYFYDPAYADYPVIMYAWEEAQTYCEWVGRRLPTEAEWEKAARGVDGRVYPWGDERDCRYAAFFDCVDDTQPVTAYLDGASPYGILNLSGNVWEWTADWYDADYYANSPLSNPGGPQEGKYHTLRGGGWNSLGRDVRAANRTSGKAEHYKDGAIGFRCVMD